MDFLLSTGKADCPLSQLLLRHPVQNPGELASQFIVDPNNPCKCDSFCIDTCVTVTGADARAQFFYFKGASFEVMLLC